MGREGVLRGRLKLITGRARWKIYVQNSKSCLRAPFSQLGLFHPRPGSITKQICRFAVPFAVLFFIFPPRADKNNTAQWRYWWSDVWPGATISAIIFMFDPESITHLLIMGFRWLMNTHRRAGARWQREKSNFETPTQKHYSEGCSSKACSGEGKE